MKLRLYLGEQHALILQNYENLSLIASQVFGKEKSSNTPDADVQVPETKEQMQAAFKSVFG